MLLGHSLGGIFLVKYLSENHFPKKIIALFLLAAPFVRKPRSKIGDFWIKKDLKNVADQVGEIFIYHSEDDPIVPYECAHRYKEEFPSATLRRFRSNGHLNQREFPELLLDLKAF
jgi:hypothetical protein